jgi:hypothetical protein
MVAGVVVAGSAAADEFKGWRVLIGTVPQNDLRAVPLDALDSVKPTFSLTKPGRRINGPGEPKLSVLCQPDNLGVVVSVGKTPANGPAERVSAEARFDTANAKVTQWILAGDFFGYAPASPLELKSFVAQFLISRQLKLALPLHANVIRLGPSDVLVLEFDLDGFAEAATDMRRTCPL